MQGSEERPPFLTASWSGFGCAGVGCLSYGLFAVAQLGAFLVILQRAHPDLWTLALRPPPHDLQHALPGWTIQASTAPNLFWLAVIGDGAMVLVALLLAKLYLDAKGRQLGFGIQTSGGQLLGGLITGLLLVVLSSLVAGAQAKIFGPHPEAVAQILKTHHGTANFLFDFASVGIVAPFAEELLFRGVIFAGLAQRMPLGWAAAISGVIFGLAHLDPWNILPLAVVGTGLALLYRRTGSLWPNIVAHGAFNAVALILVYFLPKFAT